jgi:hypothetical protein
MAAPTPDGGLRRRAVLVAHSGEGLAPRAAGRLPRVTRPRMGGIGGPIDGDRQLIHRPLRPALRPPPSALGRARWPLRSAAAASSTGSRSTSGGSSDSRNDGRSPIVRNMIVSIRSSPRGRGNLSPHRPQSQTAPGFFQVEVAKLLLIRKLNMVRDYREPGGPSK